MNYLAKIFQPYYKELADKIQKEDFVIDKTGCKIVEIIAPRIEIDMNESDGYLDFESRKSPRQYCELEHYWYGTESLNINDVNSVKIWNDICDENNQINSNYGYLVYSKGNFSQFTHCLNKLKQDKDSRQAIIIYTRPSIQVEWNDLGCSDFICTNFQQFFIRNNVLQCVTSMRSNDAIFGAFNDQPWFASVYMNMYEKLVEVYPDLKKGSMVFIPNSFHGYERHFDIIQKIANE